MMPGVYCPWGNVCNECECKLWMETENMCSFKILGTLAALNKTKLQVENDILDNAPEMSCDTCALEKLPWSDSPSHLCNTCYPGHKYYTPKT